MRVFIVFILGSLLSACASAPTKMLLADGTKNISEQASTLTPVESYNSVSLLTA